ncbi:glycosyltransferase [Arthrobacter sp. MDT1-48-3]
MSTTNKTLGSFAERGLRLINTLVFDAEYYAAEAGRDFESKRVAAAHFVQYGMKAGLSFHPLFDLGMFPVRVRDAYKSGDVEALLTYLRSPQSRTHLWSPLFDPSALNDSPSEGSVLLSRYRVGKERRLPAPPRLIGEPPLWLEARALMVAHARNAKQIELGKKPLRRYSWSESEEQAWLSSIGDAPVPTDRDNPVVSIVMPAWNRATVIAEAIDSVRRQTLKSWELIIVDDGSTDETREVVGSFAAVDRRIRLVSAEHLGVCAARNRGLEEARGDYLAFLDSDNTWRPEFLERMYAGLSIYGGPAAYSAVKMVGDKEEYTGQPITAEKLLVRNYVDLNVLVVETELLRDLGGFDLALRRWVDYDLVLRITETASIRYFPFIGCDYVDDHNEDRITRKESANWEFAVLGKNLQNRFVPDLVGGGQRSPMVSIIIRVTDSVDLAIRNIRHIQEAEGAEAVEIVLVDEVAGFRSSLRLRAALTGLSGLKYLKVPRRYTAAISYNVASEHADADLLLFLRESVELRDGAVVELTSKMTDGSTLGVQPLLTDAVGVVVSAGGVGHRNSLAVPLFKGLAVHDARRHSGRGLDELSPAAFCVRAEDFHRTGRFTHLFAGDAAVVDFLRRLKRGSQGEFIAASDALAVDHAADAFTEDPAFNDADAEWLSPPSRPARAIADHYRDIGLHVHTLTAPRRPTLQPASPVISRLVDAASTVDSLRWAIKIGADFSVGGDRWGDVPYAADLAESLRRLGQDVVVDRAGAFSRPSNHLDDVILTIRGLVPCEPQPGKVNVLWAISRPDLITQDELSGYDLVFGGSRIWCEFVAREWGIEARYLPQATNQRRFHPATGDSGIPSYELTFVGGPRKPIGRKVVADCIALGRTVSVWGPRWEQFIPAEMVADNFIDNDQLAALYGSSELVLNDHFEDMARWGFANNRLYDAVASGAKVISDEVDGIDEIFRGAVRTYSSLDDLEGILTDPGAFPDDAQMAAISEEIRHEHNFDRRAEVFVRAVAAARS